jgi:hypothetical protein
MVSQICWWEHEELLDHLRTRPDLWEPDPDSPLWIRKDSEGGPAFALQLIEPEAPGPYRMYTLSWTPVSWEEDEVEEYLLRLLYFWTSYSTRLGMEKILQDELKLDADTAYLMAVALQRAQVEPNEDPEKLPRPPRRQALWEQNVGIATAAVLPLVRSGAVHLSKHHEMIRVSIDITNPYPANGPHHFRLTGFVRPTGYTVETFTRLMDFRKQDSIQTKDPDAIQLHGWEVAQAASGEETRVFEGDDNVGVGPVGDGLGERSGDRVPDPDSSGDTAAAEETKGGGEV